jgi:predicted DNA-binding protein
LALDSSNVYAVEPNGWVRFLDKEDQGTDESHNWPDPECKFSVRLSDEQSVVLETLAKRYFAGNKTYAMVWAIMNFNALLAKDPGRLKVTKTKQAKPMSQRHTKLVSIRLPLELLADYEDQARAMHISVGRLLREQIIANWAGIRPTPTPTEQDTDDTDDFLDDFLDL